jgi:hypothetical protein
MPPRYPPETCPIKSAPVVSNALPSRRVEAVVGWGWDEGVQVGQIQLARRGPLVKDGWLVSDGAQSYPVDANMVLSERWPAGQAEGVATQ